MNDKENAKKRQPYWIDDPQTTPNIPLYLIKKVKRGQQSRQLGCNLITAEILGQRKFPKTGLVVIIVQVRRKVWIFILIGVDCRYYDYYYFTCCSSPAFQDLF